MTTEKRGSEKLLSMDNDLCSLTPDELMQVGGMGPVPAPGGNYPEIGPIRIFDGVFPRGIVPRDLFREQLNLERLNVTEIGISR